MKTRQMIEQEIELKKNILNDERFDEEYKDIVLIQLGTLRWVLEDINDA